MRSDQRKVLIQRQEIAYKASSGGLEPAFGIKIGALREPMPRANRYFLPGHIWHIKRHGALDVKSMLQTLIIRGSLSQL
jgi:hypothetical protein